MFEIIRGILDASFQLFIQMSPYLLFGFLFAGLLHVFVSLDWIARHLGRSNFASVIKAVILGIPPPALFVRCYSRGDCAPQEGCEPRCDDQLSHRHAYDRCGTP